MLPFSLTKQTTVFAEVKGYFGNNQLGGANVVELDELLVAKGCVQLKKLDVANEAVANDTNEAIVLNKIDQPTSK